MTTPDLTASERARDALVGALLNTTTNAMPTVEFAEALMSAIYDADVHFTFDAPSSYPENKIDLINMDGGYVEIDGTGWVPIAEYEQAMAATTDAADRLEALRMAAELIPAPVAGLNIGGTLEQKFAHRILAAARWVLTGDTKESSKS